MLLLDLTSLSLFGCETPREGFELPATLTPALHFPVLPSLKRLSIRRFKWSESYTLEYEQWFTPEFFPKLVALEVGQIDLINDSTFALLGPQIRMLSLDCRDEMS